MNVISSLRRSASTVPSFWVVGRPGAALSRGAADRRFDELTPPVRPLCRADSAASTSRSAVWKDSHEAPLSAKRSQTCQEARVPVSDEYPRRSCRSAVSPSEGPRPPVGVIDRLSGRRAFARLRAEGQRRGRGPIRLVVRPDAEQNARFAFAIPRSVGSAVVRNRTKRRLRAVLTELDRPSPGLAGGDHLIRITSPIDEWSHATLRTTMATLLRPDLTDVDGVRR